MKKAVAFSQHQKRDGLESSNLKFEIPSNCTAENTTKQLQKMWLLSNDEAVQIFQKKRFQRSYHVVKSK